MRDLLDASVWLPLSAPDHVHHQSSRKYWDEQTSEQLAFCRTTVLALLRHLTNRRIMGDRALNGKAAWQGIETWLAVPRVVLLSEPAGLDELLRQWSAHLDLRSGMWSDAYLAAFAIASGCRLVAFDGDFLQFPGLNFLHLAS